MLWISLFSFYALLKVTAREESDLHITVGKDSKNKKKICSFGEKRCQLTVRLIQLSATIHTTISVRYTYDPL
jgi:hypothetical protein